MHTTEASRTAHAALSVNGKIHRLPGRAPWKNVEPPSRATNDDRLGIAIDAAYANGQSVGYSKGYRDGTHWGIVCGAVCTCLIGTIVAFGALAWLRG